MSPGSHPVTRVPGLGSAASTSGMIASSSPSRPKPVPARSSSNATPSSSSAAAAPELVLRQKIDQRSQPHNGNSSSVDLEAKPRNGLPKPTNSAKPNKATPSTSQVTCKDHATHVRDPSAEAPIKKTQALPAEMIDRLPSTFRKFALQGKTAIVTGGARGLGSNMAEALCESGIKAVAIFDIQPTLGQSKAQSLNTTYGIPVKYHNVDVTNENNVESAVRQVIQQFGEIDILVNSAGVAFSNLPAETHSLDTFQRTININLVGSFCIARAVARHMIAAKPKSSSNSTSSRHLPDRSIIFIASMSGSIVNYPQPQCAYNASKAGVIQLSKCLAAEWAKHGIRVNTISPGYMDTVLNQTPALNSQKIIWKDRTPMQRLGEVEELNNVVVWLAGEGAKFVTGSDVKVDGGYSIY